MSLRKKLTIAVLAGTCALTALSGQASAALTHPFEKEIATPGCHTEDLTVDDINGYIYAACEHEFSFDHWTIQRFDLNGNPANFSANQPYLQGNEITYDPGANDKRFGANSWTFELAVDNSSANPGQLFTTADTGQGGEIDIFKPSGEFSAQIPMPLGGSVGGVDVNSSGHIFATQGTKVSEFNSAFQETGRMFVFDGRQHYLRADSTGATWVAYGTFGNPRELLRKYENDQFQPNVKIATEGQVEEAGLPTNAPTSPFAVNPLVQTGLTGFNIDPTNDDLVVDREDHIEIYSQGTAAEPSYQNNPSFGAGKLTNSEAVAIDDDRNVYAANGENIVKFAAGETLPEVHTLLPETDNIGRTTATLDGRVELLGGAAATNCVLEYGPTTAYNAGGSPPSDSGVVPCDTTSFGADSDVSASIPGANPGLVTGKTYHYRFVVTTASGTNVGADRAVALPAVIRLHTKPASQIGIHSATLNGSFDISGLETKYRFEYGLDADYGQTTPEVAAPTVAGDQEISQAVSELPSGRTFHYRLVARNSLGTTVGPDMTFRSASTPEVSGVTTTKNLAESATLNARVNPVGYETTYQFQFGTTTAYGRSAPAAPVSVGSGSEAQLVTQQIANLQPGFTYHFRVLATNEWGTTTSPDTTFDFSPPSCPNAHVRQQTHASYLPDCRGYELVSRETAGSILMFPSDSVNGTRLDSTCASCKTRYGKLWPVNTGLAISPPRFAYFGGLGSFEDLDGTNSLFDMYLSTRTSTGWVTSLPGLKGREGFVATRTRCTDALSACLDHSEGDPFQNYERAEIENSAGYFAAAGNRITTLPTNVDTVPGARYSHFEQYGDEMLAGGGGHYAFSALEDVFAPGGINTPPGSAYDNDIANKEVSLISVNQDGTPIRQEVENQPKEYVEFDGISKDGSHILIHVKGADGPEHLFMRVDDLTTYDVSDGHGVTFIGMTDDGSKVLFAAAQQLVPADTDHSIDIYEWNEAAPGDKLTLLSQGNGNGDTDECAPVGGWGSQCDAVPLETERGNPFGFSSTPPLDDHIASESGDVYFYSPEQLDPEKPGVNNQRNLYVYRNGSVHLVATFEPGTSVNRMQISPDGAHAGLLTSASLTGYDTHGFREMYSYDADSGTLLCASCRPDGLPPTGNAAASQGGPFMSNDGRVFFATKDALVPRDVNGEVIDVYEYVDGRPQLISAGTGSRDFTGGSAVLNILDIPKPSRTGLESVSADGQDVYFSTYDTLVQQDHNGPFVKFYDARVGGGFEPAPEFAPCAAADECHGEESAAAQAPKIGTEGNLGPSGNVRGTPKKEKKSKKQAKKKRKHQKRHHGRTR